MGITGADRLWFLLIHSVIRALHLLFSLNSRETGSCLHGDQLQRITLFLMCWETDPWPELDLTEYLKMCLCSVSNLVLGGYLCHPACDGKMATKWRVCHCWVSYILDGVWGLLVTVSKRVLLFLNLLLHSEIRLSLKARYWTRTL